MQAEFPRLGGLRPEICRLSIGTLHYGALSRYYSVLQMVIKLPRSRESTPVAVTPPSTTLGLVIPSAARRARARGPPLTSFGVMAFWPDKGRHGGDGGWRSGGKGGRGRLLSARHTLPARTISRMRVRATHRRLQHAMGAAAEVLVQDAEREQQREAGRRRRGQQQQRGRTSARRTKSSDRWRSKVHGAGPRGTRVRHCPSGSVSQVLNCARAC